jgi:predicted HTH transcriptional regulator
MPRNRELMRVFRDMELVEQIGSGMSRILKTYDRSIFDLSSGFTVVTFPFAEAFNMPNGKINGKIKSLKDEIVDILKTNPLATMTDLVESTGKSERTISRDLKELQEAGKLSREGARKTGKWVVA